MMTGELLHQHRLYGWGGEVTSTDTSRVSSDLGTETIQLLVTWSLVIGGGDTPHPNQVTLTPHHATPSHVSRVTTERCVTQSC